MSDQPGMTAASTEYAASPPLVDEPTRPAPDVSSPNGSGRRARRGGSTALTPSDDVGRSDKPHVLSRKERRQLGRLRARKVHRVVRHVDPWSVLKLSLAFYVSLFIVTMVAGTVLWNLAAAGGTIHSVEGFVKDLFAFKSFTFDGPVILRASFLIGLILVIAGSALNVLLAVLFNLVSDLVGGIRVTVIEEETARPVAPNR